MTYAIKFFPLSRYIDGSIEDARERVPAATITAGIRENRHDLNFLLRTAMRSKSGWDGLSTLATSNL